MSVRRRWHRPVVWLRLLGKWIAREWAWWLFAFLCVAAAAFFSSAACTERALRFSGLVLQAGGFLTVAYGLHSTGREFGRAFGAALIEYLRAFPSMRAKHHVIQGQAIAPSVSAAGSSRLSVQPSPGLTLEERIAHIDRQMAQLTKEIASVRKEHGRHLREYEANREADRRDWQAADLAARELIKRAMVGNLHVETAGLAMFLVGLIAATLAPEFPGPDACRQAFRFFWVLP